MSLDKVIIDQNVLKQKYSNYNTAYMNYVSCQTLSKKVDGTACDYDNGLNALDDASGNLNSNISTEKNDLSKFSSTLPSNAVEDAAFNAIKAQYQTNSALRAQLDAKLQELYNTQGSLPNLHQAQVDSTVYAGILWTVLATSLIYYVFIKL